MTHPDLIVGTTTGDDAAVWRRPDGRALVATVDFFAPIVDDPVVWGRVAATNSASDVYAMGGTPLFALNVIAWPKDHLPMSVLGDVLAGMSAAAADGGWIVAGGHTVDGPEPMAGQAVIGELPEGAEPFTNAGARPGDVLLLTKPLGSGLLATAHKRLAPEDMAEGGRFHTTYRAAVEAMCTLNDRAARAARAADAHSVTDVTGFGLAGHLHKMMAASGTSARLSITALPLLPGVHDLIGEGFVPGGTLRNLAFVGDALVVGSESDRLLLGDPQTSGGLLVACSPGSVGAFTDVYPAAVIGEVTAGEPGTIHAA